MGHMLSGLSTFFSWLMDYTIDISILICVIFIIKSIVARKLPAWWHYSLWMVLLLRMILPWQINTPLTITNVVPITIDESLFESVLIEEHLITAGSITTEVAAAPQGWNIQVNDVLLGLWMAGALFLGGYILIKNLKFRNSIRKEPLLTEKRTLDLLKKCRRRMKVRRQIKVTVTDKIKSPALYGYFRPRLLLPVGISETLDDSKMSYIFMHELGHLKRHDIGVSWIISILQVFQWFNPFVWMAFHQMRVDQESACDASVLSRIKDSQSVDYASTIVGFIENIYRSRKLPSLVGILESQTQLKKRISMIVNFRKNSKIMILVSNVFLIIVAVLFFSFTGSVKHNYEITVPGSSVEHVFTHDTEGKRDTADNDLRLNVETLRLDEGYEKILASGQDMHINTDLNRDRIKRVPGEVMPGENLSDNISLKASTPEGNNLKKSGTLSPSVDSTDTELIAGSTETEVHPAGVRELPAASAEAGKIQTEALQQVSESVSELSGNNKEVVKAPTPKALDKNSAAQNTPVPGNVYGTYPENVDILKYYRYAKIESKKYIEKASLPEETHTVGRSDKSPVRTGLASAVTQKQGSSENISDENRIYKKQEIDETPKVLSYVPPIYPFQARAKGIEGSVLLRFTVDKEGRVVKPKVVKAVPEGIFEQAALATVVKYKLKPAMKDGKPVTSVARLTISFSVDDSNRFMKFAQR
jgi:TonB family protein